MNAKNLYLDNGYVNIPYLIQTAYTFIMITGARGTGKTYGIGKELLLNSTDQIIYMRRTGVELEIATSNEYNTFSRLAKDAGMDISFKPLKIGSELRVNDQPRGLALPLSTFSNVRGFEGTNIKWIFFDEFIPEVKRNRSIDEAITFFHAYETVNRNRELNGEPPVRVICAANSNNLDNDFYKDLKIVNIISRMEKNGGQIYTDNRRSLLVINLNASPISTAKRETALYKLTGGTTSFDAVSLENTYNDLAAYRLKSYNLQGFKPLWRVGDLEFYKRSDIIYGTSHLSGAPVEYENTDIGIAKFRRDHAQMLYNKYISGKVFFETAEDEIFFRSMIF